MASAEEMHDAVGKALSNTGLQSKIKSELRFQLIDKLRKQQQIELSGSPDLREKAVWSMILDTLKKKDKIYSLSILTPECGLKETDVLKRSEICQVLGIDMLDLPPTASLGVHAGTGMGMDVDDGSGNENGEGGPTLLEELFSWIKAKQEFDRGAKMKKRDAMIQTDVGQIAAVAHNLEFKLNKIDGELRLDKNKDHTKFLQEKMLLYQQQCEKRYRSELESELSRIRAIERSQIRLEESQRARAEGQTKALEMKKRFDEREEILKGKEARAMQRLKQKETELEKKLTEQRNLLLRKMEEQNGKMQRKSEWVSLEETKLNLAREGIKKMQGKLEEERKLFEQGKKQLQDTVESQITKYKLECENNLQEDWSKAREFQLSLEKEKCQIDLWKQEVEKTKAESDRYFEELTKSRKHAIALEDRVAELKTLFDSSQRQLTVSAEQIKEEQKNVDKLKALNRMHEQEKENLGKITEGNKNKEAALQMQMNENVRLMTKQVEDLRKEMVVRNAEFERVNNLRAKAEKEVEDRKELAFKMQEVNLRLKSDVERLQRRNEEALIRDRDFRRLEQMMLMQYQSGVQSPGRSPGSVQHQDLDPEKLYHQWETQLDLEIGKKKSEPTTSKADPLLERKTKKLNDEIAEFARTGFGNKDVDSILKEVEIIAQRTPAVTTPNYVIGGAVASNADPLLTMQNNYMTEPPARQNTNRAPSMQQPVVTLQQQTALQQHQRMQLAPAQHTDVVNNSLAGPSSVAPTVNVQPASVHENTTHSQLRTIAMPSQVQVSQVSQGQASQAPVQQKLDTSVAITVDGKKSRDSVKTVIPEIGDEKSLLNVTTEPAVKAEPYQKSDFGNRNETPISFDITKSNSGASQSGILSGLPSVDETPAGLQMPNLRKHAGSGTHGGLSHERASMGEAVTDTEVKDARVSGYTSKSLARNRIQISDSDSDRDKQPLLGTAIFGPFGDTDSAPKSSVKSSPVDDNAIETSFKNPSTYQRNYDGDEGLRDSNVSLTKNIQNIFNPPSNNSLLDDAILNQTDTFNLTDTVREIDQQPEMTTPGRGLDVDPFFVGGKSPESSPIDHVSAFDFNNSQDIDGIRADNKESGDPFADSSGQDGSKDAFADSSVTGNKDPFADSSVTGNKDPFADSYVTGNKDPFADSSAQDDIKDPFAASSSEGSPDVFGMSKGGGGFASGAKTGAAQIEPQTTMQDMFKDTESSDSNNEVVGIGGLGAKIDDVYKNILDRRGQDKAPQPSGNDLYDDVGDPFSGGESFRSEEVDAW